MYPTKEEILEAMSTTDVTPYVTQLQEWKEMHYSKQWSKLSTDEKNIRLMLLCYKLYMVEKTNQLIVHKGEQYLFYPDLNEINIQHNKPSILSTLHEIGHAVWGPEEIDACRFSVKLYMTVFPEVYETLEWSGHMLIKK